MVRSMNGLVAGLALLGCVSAASADVHGEFSVTIQGEVDLKNLFEDLDFGFMGEDILYQEPFLEWEMLQIEAFLTGTSDPFDFEGEFDLEGGLGGLEAMMMGTLLFGDEFITAEGTWELVEGDGAFEDFTGSGDFSIMTNNMTGFTEVTISGVLVPAPGALALVACGMLVSRRRRRL